MGINMSQAFPTKYLSANDVTDQGITVRIQSVQMEQVDQDTTKPAKPVVYFQGEHRGMVLNVTNNNTIMDMYGADSDGWVGRDIVLFKTAVDFQGRMVNAIRVRPGTNQANLAQNAQSPVTPATPMNSEDPNPNNLESPFGNDPLNDLDA